MKHGHTRLSYECVGFVSKIFPYANQCFGEY